LLLFLTSILSTSLFLFFAFSTIRIPLLLQPGHAAMVRWTPNGWQTALGAGIYFSYWDGQTGRDFEYEANARNVLDTDMQYEQLVTRLQLVSIVMGEKANFVSINCTTDKNAPWYSLQLLQRMRVCAAHKQYRQKYAPSNRPNQWTFVKARGQEKDVCEAVQFNPQDGGSIVIPATTFLGPRRGSKVAEYLSFLGGRQIFVPADTKIEYELGANYLPAAPRDYQFQLRLSTVHRNEEPATLTVSVNNESPRSYTVPMPYTVGQWELTAPVTISLPGNANGGIKLSFQRKSKAYGIAIKEIVLTPV
jgi:hypothetical protein